MTQVREFMLSPAGRAGKIEQFEISAPLLFKKIGANINSELTTPSRLTPKKLNVGGPGTTVRLILEEALPPKVLRDTMKVFGLRRLLGVPEIVHNESSKTKPAGRLSLMLHFGFWQSTFIQKTWNNIY